ncbi:MAG TPA: hypothetical protein VLL94_04820, partial [Nitrospiraceae bacterium]|nr:hypothetical protein [Nitrospiraceae bacterium]
LMLIRRRWSRRSFGRRRRGLNRWERHVLRRLREGVMDGETRDEKREQEEHEHQSATHWKPVPPRSIVKDGLYYIIESAQVGRVEFIEESSDS